MLVPRGWMRVEVFALDATCEEDSLMGRATWAGVVPSSESGEEVAGEFPGFTICAFFAGGFAIAAGSSVALRFKSDLVNTIVEPEDWLLAVELRWF